MNEKNKYGWEETTTLRENPTTIQTMVLDGLSLGGLFTAALVAFSPLVTILVLILTAN